MIVLDASALIAHLDQNDAHHQMATERLLEAADEQFGASSVTLAEVLVGPTRAGRIDAAWAALQTLGVEELPLPASSSERLAELRVHTSLKLPDCCVLLAAETCGGRVLTFDERLAREATRLSLDS